MKNLTLFVLLLCFFAMVEMSSSQVFERDRYVPVNPINRKLTRKEIRNLKPRIDGVPRGTIKPHPLTGTTINKNPAIIGGKPAVENQFPWMVAMVFDNIWFCGGSVISQSWVLTAAHCAYNITNVQMFLGSVNWKDNETRISFNSSLIIMHEKYSPTRHSNDITLVKLPTPIDDATITAGRIIPILLPRQSEASLTFENLQMTVSGWGYNMTGGTVSPTLNFVPLIVISNAKCASLYGSVILSSNICTSPGTSTVQTNTCKGDSGSGLHMKGSDGLTRIYGIVSFGVKTSCTAYPSAHTRVTSYLTWISSKTGLAIAPK